VRSRTFVGRVLAGVALLGCGALSACALLLDGAPALGDECEFDGDYSDCGECVLEACEEELGECCGGACGESMEHLDRCAGLDDYEACDALKQAGEDDDAASKLGRCVERNCGGSCSSAAPITSCSGDDDRCSCVIDRDDPNDDECEADEVGSCCASLDWPSTGSCECARLDCLDDGSSCRCTRGAAAGSGTPALCDQLDYAICCVTSFGCECRDFGDCGEDEEYTSECWGGADLCAYDEYEVEACNLTEDDDV
jgi:hypothetical protein